MVVILLLTPYTANGCDGGSDASRSTPSTTSTAATAIPSEAFNFFQTKQQRTEAPPSPDKHRVPPNHALDTSQCHHTAQHHRSTTDRQHPSSFEDPHRNRAHGTKSRRNGLSAPFAVPPKQNEEAVFSPSISPPPLPKSKPPYAILHPGKLAGHYNHANAVPKPPRSKQPPTCQRVRIPLSGHRASAEAHPTTQQQAVPPHKNTTNFSDIVRHVTRVNFYDVDTLQIEFEPKDDDNSDTEAVTKEEEWITKKKTELTTTRQIETRVKRQVVLADGKVVEDSGPIVSTNTTEDTDKQETETTEKRDLGDCNSQHNASVMRQDATANGAGAAGESAAQLLAVDAMTVAKVVPRPADGLVRETSEQRVVTHEEIKDYLETEDVQHLGDFSDETYIKAINSNDNLTETLLAAATNQKQLVVAPHTTVIAATNKSHKTIDTEDTLKRCFAQPDGTLVTENERTTKHEVIVDADLPAARDDRSRGSHEQIAAVESHQRFFEQKDAQSVDILADGKVVGAEMRYTAETMQLEKDGSLERSDDWDSFSDRMRKLRKPQKSLLQQQKEAAPILDRKDALTKRPLDLDREEETRKGETIRWLASHFGSESTASNDSRDDTEMEPTKRTFFNIVIKSSPAPKVEPTTTGQRLLTASGADNEYQKTEESQTGATKARYYQSGGERRSLGTHFATKAFQDDLKEAVERSRLRRDTSNNTDISYNVLQTVFDPKSIYVSREDILRQKRQSISSQLLARSKRDSEDLSGSKDTLDKLDDNSHDDVAIGLNEDEKPSPGALCGKDFNSKGEPNFLRRCYRELEREMSRNTASKNSYNIIKYSVDSAIPSIDLPQTQSKTPDRPTVPARKRTVEKKVREIIRVPSELTVACDKPTERAEPPPDYSPPPRSCSASPQMDYISASRAIRTSTVDSSHYTANAVTARKLNQRTRFAPLSPHAVQMHPQVRPKMSTQTTQTTPSTLSLSTAASNKSSKVGRVIGNSIRKLVSKIRSASAEPKSRMKSKTKSRDQSLTTQGVDKSESNSYSATYQQYNLIDTHIEGQTTECDGFEPDYARQQQVLLSNQARSQALPNSHSHVYNNSNKVEINERTRTLRRRESTDLHASQRNMDGDVSPRQRYYLREDPYSGTLYGKENMYNVNSGEGQSGELSTDFTAEERQREPNRYVTSNTLGRYQKSSQRLVGSTLNLANNYQTVKTLPRKLADRSECPPEHSIDSKKDDWTRKQVIAGNTGPIKPPRSFPKNLNRSKSFSLHALNGSSENDSVTTGNIRHDQRLTSNSNVERNPYSTESTLLQSGLKSPSIVNLISRSQKDLTKIGVDVDERGFGRYPKRSDVYKIGEKKIFLQDPDSFESLHADEVFRHREVHKYPLRVRHSLDSRSAIQINKDTAGIVRGDAYGTSKGIAQLYKEESPRRSLGPTVIALYRK